jgi:hypothetical protein
LEPRCSKHCLHGLRIGTQDSDGTGRAYRLALLVCRLPRVERCLGSLLQNMLPLTCENHNGAPMSYDHPLPNLVTCPDCKGKKKVFAHVNYGGERPGEFKHIACMRCKGVGAIEAEMLVWIEAGRKRRAERVSRDISLREEAKRLGMNAADLSAIEMGYRRA